MQSEPDKMHIEVVDDCSPKVDVMAMVREIAGDRIKISQTPKNLGLAGCWNACIERARGEWVHILHQDDYVLPGFYQRLALAAKEHPDVTLLATRSFLVDGNGIIVMLTKRLPELENGGHGIDNFYYDTPLQCAGVAVKREFYENHGGFLSSLVFLLDREMWVRAISLGGGVVTPETLACYRVGGGTETGRLAQTGEDLGDMERLNQIFAKRYPGFDQKKAARHLCSWAFDLATGFARNGNTQAAESHLNYWKTHAPVQLRLRKLGRKVVEKILG